MAPQNIAYKVRESFTIETKRILVLFSFLFIQNEKQFGMNYGQTTFCLPPPWIGVFIQNSLMVYICE